MANDITTYPRLWSLDTTGNVKAAGNIIGVRAVHFEPAAGANVCNIAEYGIDGSTAQDVIKLKANAGAADPVDKIYEPPVELNGMNLRAITAGTVYIEIAYVNTK